MQTSEVMSQRIKSARLRLHNFNTCQNVVERTVAATTLADSHDRDSLISCQHKAAVKLSRPRQVRAVTENVFTEVLDYLIKMMYIYTHTVKTRLPLWGWGHERN